MAGALATFGTNALSRHARVLAARSATYGSLANRPVGRLSRIGLALPPASPTSGADHCASKCALKKRDRMMRKHTAVTWISFFVVLAMVTGLAWLALHYLKPASF